MINSAVYRLEAYCDTKFIHETWYQYFDMWPQQQKNDWWDGVRDLPISELWNQAKEIKLSLGPVVQVNAINTFADDGIAQLFDSSNYVVDTSGKQGRIALKIGATWPTTILRKINGIEIEFQVGLSDSAANTHSYVKQAILEYVAQMYEQRGDEKTPIPNSSINLLQPLMRYKAGFFGTN